MYRIFYLLFAATILFTSCNNDDDAGTPEPEEENFYALTVGNTWEYDYYKFNTQTEDFVLMDAALTKTITGTTEINGETFYNIQTVSTGTFNCIFCNEEVQNELVRDSLGYQIYTTGTISFATEDETEYKMADQPFGEVFGKLVAGTSTVEVEAGTFATVRNINYVKFPSGELSVGVGQVLYADGIGMIKETASAISSPLPFGEIRLRSYTQAQD